ncbi:TonB-dependent receptor [Sphingomonas sp. BK036]|uniref:TonB-dependent receptor n=1 Tax=Sphingomonas sp. BK036 TaxID=2512122 RepID=UPI001029BD8F|nr:TonB-dependent receptor [Sphingomonas sp. BK036]RZT53155.1 TonB-dependent receptor [Sphingomonas sp. BK036]
MLRKIRLHLLLSSVSLAGIAGTPATAQAAPPASRTFTFDLPAQALGDALLAFSRLTRLQLASSPAVLNGARSPRLQGRMTAADALARLTADSDVDGRIVDGTVTIARHKRFATAAASAAAVAGDGAGLQASESTVEPQVVGGGDIVVTGYRESVAKAQQIKKNATGSQDVILAQDIAAFPDQNLAEALQRIPGVAITRDSGEGRQISLRGLGADFTRTQLNGMEVLTNTSSGLDSRSSVSRSRAFDYSIFASELFNKVVVEKSYAAEQDEGGIGGTVGLHTAKPFDFNRLTLVASAKGQTNRYTRTVTPRLVGLISERWGDFGVLASVAYSTADTVEYGYRNWNWSQINFGAANVGPAISAADRALLVNATGASRIWNSRAQTYATFFNKRERLGLTTVLQYHPDDRTDLTLDVLYGKLNNDRTSGVIGAAGTNGIAANNVTGTQLLTGVTFDDFNDIVGASFDHVDMRTESKVTHDQTTFWQAALNGHTDLSSNLTVNFLGGWSRSTFDSRYAEVYLEAVGKSYAFTGLNTGSPRTSYGFDTTDASQWDLQGLETRADRIKSEFYNTKAELAWTIGSGSTIKAGAGFKRFTNSGWQRKVAPSYEGKPGIPDVPTTTLSNSTLAPYTIGDVAGTYALLGQPMTLTAGNTVAGTAYGLLENTYGAYLQYDLATELGTIGLRANFGVRYYHTDLGSSGTALVGSALVPVNVTNSYHGFLPAANLAFDLSRSVVFRLSGNRNLSRPALSDMRAAGTLNLASFGGTIAAGNPNLAPFKADSVEASLEYYDGKRGSLAIGAFYKHMDSYITSETRLVGYDTTGYPASLLPVGVDPSVLVNYTRPINGPGASIKGIEIAAKRDFDFLPAPFDKLGVLGNVTLAEGSTDVFYAGVPVRLPLPTLSKFSSNATLYYDTDRWGVRGSVATRSRYRWGDGGNGNIGEYIKGTTNLDASAYVNLTPQFKLSLDVINITNEPIVQYADGTAKRVMTNTVSGRTVAFGGTMRF